MKKIIILSCILSLELFSTTYALDISGNYKCLISSPGSSKQYPGTLTVNQAEDTYQFHWQFSRKVNFMGTALKDEELKSIAVVGYQVEKPSSISLTTFRISANGELKGRYVALGSKQVGIENCKRAG